MRVTVQVQRPGFEGGDHSADRFVEQNAHHLLQESRPEFEVDEEIDLAGILAMRSEYPVIVKIFERSVLIGDVDPQTGPVQGHLAGEALADALESDDEIGDQNVVATAAHPGADAPGQEFRIPPDIGDKVEKLLGRVRKHPFFGMRRHPAAAVSPGRKK